LMIT